VANAGDIIEGTVTASESFGAYVECDGQQYFIPLHELSWTVLTHASDALGVGDRISFFVDRPASPTGSDGPLGSMRRVHPEQSPWRDPTIYSVGTVFVGVVDRLMSYGAFIRHPRNALALLHADDFCAIEIRVGDTIQVVVTECDVEAQQIRVKPN
jgi:ribosomal protein S1